MLHVLMIFLLFKGHFCHSGNHVFDPEALLFPHFKTNDIVKMPFKADTYSKNGQPKIPETLVPVSSCGFLFHMISKAHVKRQWQKAKGFETRKPRFGAILLHVLQV